MKSLNDGERLKNCSIGASTELAKGAHRNSEPNVLATLPVDGAYHVVEPAGKATLRPSWPYGLAHFCRNPKKSSGANLTTNA